ncbi:hypothetical protein [Micromonospora sp. CPCC 206061]|uniref:hypothetical protein n=1 Tax=Micromonospora sp. CPCC 206061 TaxID=3122410 RepID=UPI002FF194D6
MHRALARPHRRIRAASAAEAAPLAETSVALLALVSADIAETWSAVPVGVLRR